MSHLLPIWGYDIRHNPIWVVVSASTACTLTAMPTKHIPCTVVVGAPIVRCGAPAVAHFTASTGETFGECITHVSDHLLFGDIVFEGTFELVTA